MSKRFEYTLTREGNTTYFSIVSALKEIQEWTEKEVA